MGRGLRHSGAAGGSGPVSSARYDLSAYPVYEYPVYDSCANCSSAAPPTTTQPLAVEAEEADDNTAKIACESPELDNQLQLHIPQVNYQGQYYWANLQLNVLNGKYILEVLDYGSIDPANVSVCTQEVTLSNNWDLYIPEVTYPTGIVNQFFDVQLQSYSGDYCCPTCSCVHTPIRFEVTDFRN